MDHGIDDKEALLLDRVSAAFEPYLLPPQEVSSVRRSLRSYIAARVDTAQNPRQGLEGLRAEYVKAVQANRAAKSRYAAILARHHEHAATSDPADSATAGHSSRSLLGQHVELLRLERQHTTLITLEDELDALRRSSRFTTSDTLSRAGTTPSALPDTERELAQLVDLLTRSVKALERALVEAHHYAIHERSLLEDAKAQSQYRTSATLPQRLHALSAARRELTAWLEESLERCQGNTDEAGQDEHLKSKLSSSDLEQNIDHQYEQYLETRQRLLMIVSSLKAPLPEQAPETPGGRVERMVQNFTKTEWPEEAEVPNVLEQALLPTVQQERASRAHLTFAKEQQEDELLATVNMLDRLSDESQILQAFPLLARSGRFEHAASTFGKKRATVDEPEDEVSRRMKPWLFAAEAAEVATSSTIEELLKQGNRSMDNVGQSLSELRFLHEADGNEHFKQ
ncbi:hypothetical protein A1O3_10128 [Capronia epimyces CBS 606.96]|uniref:Uncharacterized protein n=1 Tax=Capronia epimyces CBS 606.96 TaxID=1182542 RepID=W9XJ28_9EURO|nr:uncharacterized protein A1O3_10128 [Capronia epimyces CBS 606.96]EXJ76971.1 hypothetical protein A1O3_10128 [Capronia epimyces CBS 606.96]